MKKLVTVVIVLMLAVLILAEETKPLVAVNGRILAEFVNENNMMDFTNFDEDLSLGNDKMSYGHSRVDLNFKAEINKMIYAKVATRFEGKGGDKYMNFGDDAATGNDQYNDALIRLQQAYVGFNKFYGLPINFTLGRKLIKYDSLNLMFSYLDGAEFNLVFGDYYLNFHNAFLKQDLDFTTVEEDHNEMIMGAVVGSKKLMGFGSANGYFWRRGTNVLDGTDATKTVCDAKNVIGFRANLSFMNKMLCPFVEFATQSGSDGQDSGMEYSGTFIDVGTKVNLGLGAGNIDALVRFEQASGDDKNTADNNETFDGVGKSYNVEGYQLLNVGKGNVQMINVAAGFTPNAFKDIRLGFSYRIFNDTTQNYAKLVDGFESGENMYNELGVDLTLTPAKKVNIYAGLSMITPNKDYNGLEDTGMGMWVGSEVKW